ncbi:MAG TPA: protein tyrosine phosphatase [Nitrobacter sp.]|nr:protein tyrosine phosphatase [Nitrobacter sp.]
MPADIVSAAAAARSSIHVSPLSRLPEVAAALGSFDLLSLLSPGLDADRGTVPAERHLHLTFHDVSESRSGLITPDRDMIAAILGFGRSASAARPILIHCWAGISRSSAAAFILACDRHPGREQAIADELRRRAPFATPNPLMVALADDLLACDGRMIGAIAAIGRGAEAFEGTPYELPLTF